MNRAKLSRFLFLLVCLSPFVTLAQEISLQKDYFFPGEKITVLFSAPDGLNSDAWIGIVPANIAHGSEAQNDANDVAYQYLKGRSSGSLTFVAPTQHGSYDFRMNDTDNNGHEIAYVNFQVGNAYQTDAKVSIELNKNVFQPNENIVLNFSAPSTFPGDAWVGIVPSHVPHGKEAVNDSHDIAFQHLKNRSSGSLVFKAPEKVGEYDFRMHDTDANGGEVAHESFVVVAGQEDNSYEASIELDNYVFKPGETIVARFTAPASYDRSAWLGIIPSGIEHGSEATNDANDVAYQYLEKKTQGSFTFTAPREPGEYDFRMNDNDNNGREVASITFVVE